MCVGSVYIVAHKSFSPEPEVQPDAPINYSFEISSDYVFGENCSYIHETPFAYCGESNLEDCRACNRQGCTVIQCGREVSNAKTALTNFVNIKKLIHSYLIGKII